MNNLGYEILHNLFAAHEVDAMRTAISETMDRVARSLRAPFELSCPSFALEERLDAIWRKDRSYAHMLFRAALVDSQRDSRVEAIAAHPELTGRIAGLLSPLKRTGHTIRARASVPAFAEDRTRWHQDVVNPSSDGCGSVRLACWIPLMDVDEESGALEVMPGQWSNPLPHRGERDGRFFIPPENLPAGHRKTVCMQRGDVLVLDRFLPHRSLEVRNARARWTVVMWVKASERNAG
jgi:ectoine hydroxylase-related dioxygenase (phytanoyl-CoA dioxygenase family)